MKSLKTFDPEDLREKGENKDFSFSPDLERKYSHPPGLHFARVSPSVLFPAEPVRVSARTWRAPPRSTSRLTATLRLLSVRFSLKRTNAFETWDHQRSEKTVTKLVKLSTQLPDYLLRQGKITKQNS